MKRERLDFWRWMPTLRDLYFHASIFGPKQRLVPSLAAALEVCYMTGALEALGLAQGYQGDDCRVRCLALQKQAAERLAELRDVRYFDDPRGALNIANRTVKWRMKQRDKRFNDPHE
jgi:hypothetical protein